jgi:hypothetical protein
MTAGIPHAPGPQRQPWHVLAPPPTPSQSPSAEPTLVICAWNINGLSGLAYRSGGLPALLASLNSDIVCFQVRQACMRVRAPDVDEWCAIMCARRRRARSAA